jgi:hypothetical protein
MGQIQPSLERVVERFAQAGQVQFTRDNGGQLAVTVSRSYGLSLYGTADRYNVVGGMMLVGEVVVDDWSCRVEFVVDRAVFDTPTNARIQLEALFVTCNPWRPRHRAPRLPVHGLSSVRAMWCQSVIDGTVFDSVAVALSRDGLVLSTWRALRPGDNIAVRTRLHGILLEADLWVEAVLPGDRPDHSLVDCLFVEPSREVLDIVDRVTALHEERDGLSLVDLEEVRRALVEADEHAERPRLRKLLA